MDMSDTPETDASCGYALSSHHGRLEGSYLQMDWSGPFVHAEVARKLERERDEARDEAQRLRVQLNHYTQANEMAEQAFRERDEAHKIAEQAIDDLAWFNETNAQRLRNELEQLKDKKN
jgi:hypothetical protein